MLTTRRSVARRSQECCPSLLDAALTERDAAALAKRFAALADSARLRLLSLIAAHDEGEVCACDLVEPIGRSQPTVSHHLKVLRQAGLIEGERRGTWIWYRVVPNALTELGGVLGGDASRPGASAPKA